MKYSIETRAPEKQQSDCIILPLFEDAPLPSAASFINQAENQQLSMLIERKDFDAKSGACMLIAMAGIS